MIAGFEQKDVSCCRRAFNSIYPPRGLTYHCPSSLEAAVFRRVFTSSTAAGYGCSLLVCHVSMLLGEDAFGCWPGVWDSKEAKPS